MNAFPWSFPMLRDVEERDYSVIATLTPKDTKVVSWRIVNNSYNRKYPSDHFPVVIEWSLAE